MSHGNLVNTGPAEIIWEATCTGSGAPNTCDNDDHAGLHNSHLLELEMQVKLGCDFGADKAATPVVATDDATVWLEQHTIWWRTEQHVSTPRTNDGNADGDANVLSWSGECEGTENWGAAQPKPAPYIFIYSDDKCTPADSVGDTEQNGMRWGVNSEVIPVAENMDAVKSKAEVLSMIEEQQLDQTEAMDVKFAEATKETSDAKVRRRRGIRQYKRRAVNTTF